MAHTSIEWADRSWNAVVGCSIVSPGCTNCYAMAMAARIEAMHRGTHVKATIGSQSHGPFPETHYEGMTKRVNGRAVWTGNVALAPHHIRTAPLRWRKTSRIFVNSMGDLFHESVPAEWIDKVFAVMALAPQHTFIVLTKRARRMWGYGTHGSMSGIWEQADTIACGIPQHKFHPLAEEFLNSGKEGAAWPLSNVHLGVSCEDQARADERIPDLLATPAAVRFVSAEPLIGPINFRHRLDWIICGGESGPGARPMHVEWARSIREQCAAAGVPFFMKQLGSHVIQGGKRLTLRDRKGADMSEWPHDLRIQEFPR